MELADILSELGLAAEADAVRELLDAVPAAGAPADWRCLAAALTRTLVPGGAAVAPWPRWDAVAAPLVLGVAGAQGSGKSTLAAELVRFLAAAGARAVACSIDDFYLSRDRRQALARDVHPLLATRGVPGTHDVALLERTIGDLRRPGSVALPVFDKGADDPRPRAQWRSVTAPVDVFVLEGWCVGAQPESGEALARPVNALESEEDAEGVWRGWVNEQLDGPYRALWNRLSGLLFLEIPGFDAVLRWRGQQEQAIAPAQRMSEAALRRFVDHYQRLTLSMLRTLPDRAALTARLDHAHRLAELRLNR